MPPGATEATNAGTVSMTMQSTYFIDEEQSLVTLC